MKFEDRKPEHWRQDTDSQFKWVGSDDPRFMHIKEHYNQLQGRKQEKEENLAEVKKTHKALQARYDNALKARALIQKVAQGIQAQLQFRIGSIVSLALSAIFPDPYTFELEFVERRNRTEADLWFVKDGEKMKPIDSSGGGPLDVASFALVCSFWSLEGKKRPVLAFDEPMKFLSRDLQPKAALMIRELAARLGLQFIITSHIGELLDSADRVFEVTIDNGKSRVEQR
jgi:DNA repair exonuclease SbcCD ATPase subunit